MTSYLRILNPVPYFPEYTGPHKVGTIDVELPVSELESPSPSPDESIETVQFRIFYPCSPDEKTHRPIPWLPSPQRAHVSAYTRFLGAGSLVAEIISFFPRLLHFIYIPVRKNAPLLPATTESGRWPVMIFSHGLGGSRNAYSHLLGSIASHGVIAIAPEHRDGSTPISYIRDVPKAELSLEKSSSTTSKRTVTYNRMSHTPSPEVHAGRNSQLKLRLWELGCIHDALTKMDGGSDITNLNSSSSSLSLFKGKMAIHEPGSIIFGGHSFGAATVAQFVKSTFYAPENSTAPPSYEPLFSPSSRSAISSQITPNTPLILLDIWCMPLRAASTRWLWNKPMPCYSPGGPGGCSILAVESQTFFKWRLHLKATKRLLSPKPAMDSCRVEDDGRPGPHIYYAAASAHLNQSDFGILFPWATWQIFSSEEPERVLKLNVRAILQLLRERHIPVSPTSAADMEMGAETELVTTDDARIFGSESEGERDIRGWYYISSDASDLSDQKLDDDHDSAAVPDAATAATLNSVSSSRDLLPDLLTQQNAALVDV